MYNFKALVDLECGQNHDESLDELHHIHGTCIVFDIDFSAINSWKFSTICVHAKVDEEAKAIQDQAGKHAVIEDSDASTTLSNVSLVIDELCSLLIWCKLCMSCGHESISA